MEKIITNDNNLKEEDMTEIVKRVKVLLINNSNQILLGYSNNEYQFIGGHVEQNESYIEAINREVIEETGIELNIKESKPFACSYGYYKDWPFINNNRKIEIYYYLIETDLKPNLKNTKYTKSEKEGKFELRYILLDEIENELKNNSKKYGDKHGITKEMLKVINIYKNKYNK